MGFMAARTGVAAAPPRIIPNPAMPNAAGTQRTAEDLLSTAEELRCAFPMETADHLWQMADDAMDSIDKAQKAEAHGTEWDGTEEQELVSRQTAEAKLGAAVKAAMAAVSSASSVVAAAKKAERLDFPREVARAVRQAQADAAIEQLEAVEVARGQEEEKFQKKLEKNKENIKEEVVIEAKKIAHEKVRKARISDRAEFRKDMEMFKREAIEAQEETVAAALSSNDLQHQHAISVLRDEKDDEIKKAKKENKEMVKAAKSGCSKVNEELEMALKATLTVVDELKEQETATVEEFERRTAESIAEHAEQQREMMVTVTQAQAEAKAAVEERERAALENQVALAAAVDAARAEGEVAKQSAIAELRQQADERSRHGRSLAEEVRDEALEKAAVVAAEALAEAVRQSREQCALELTCAVAEAKLDASKAARLEAASETALVARAATEKALANAVEAERSAAGLEVQAAVAKEYESRQSEMDALWQERVAEAHENAHAWAERAEALAAAEEEALQALQKTRETLATITVRELARIRYREWQELKKQQAIDKKEANVKKKELKEVEKVQKQEEARVRREEAKQAKIASRDAAKAEAMANGGLSPAASLIETLSSPRTAAKAFAHKRAEARADLLAEAIVRAETRVSRSRVDVDGDMYGEADG